MEMRNAVVHNLAWVRQKQERASDTWSMNCRHSPHKSHSLVTEDLERIGTTGMAPLARCGISVFHPYPVKLSMSVDETDCARQQNYHCPFAG